MKTEKEQTESFPFYRGTLNKPMSNEMLILIPIARELCPKLALKFAHSDTYLYALQGALIAEIRRQKQELKDYRQAFSTLQKSFQMEISEISNERLKHLSDTLRKRYE